MRRSQSTRNQAKQSLAPGAEDLTILQENGESPDMLRSQLLEKDRENDKVVSPLIGTDCASLTQFHS